VLKYFKWKGVNNLREILRINRDWKFFKGDPEPQPIYGHQAVYMASKTERGQGFASRDFYDADWENITIPHDYVIQEDYDKTLHGCHGYLPRNNSWYRRSFKTLEEYKNMRITIIFDGILTHSTVWVNGHLMERNFCGYTSFEIDITDILKPVGDVNVIAVKVDVSEFEGWWYEGAGINKNVWLLKTNKVAISTWGTYVNPVFKENEWNIEIESRITNRDFKSQEIEIEHILVDKDKKIIKSQREKFNLSDQNEDVHFSTMKFKDPILWSIDNPYLYTVISRIYSDGIEIDTYETETGFRTLLFDADKGFFLNGEFLKIKGVCGHFDHGGLGSALPEQILELRIKKLKSMGCNAFRCGHTPPAPEFLNLCDKYGLLVMDESRWFETSRDGLSQLKNMIIRDRNHPSVFIWSVGNEEPVQSTSVGENIAIHLKKFVKSFDKTRPVTVALNGGFFDSKVSKASDVVGVNYNYRCYDELHKLLPNHPICSPEVGATSNTRSIYKNDPENGHFLAYDEIAASFGSTHRKAWMEVDKRDFVFGLFVWTGFEYRGESTWPKLFAGGGAFDSSGFEKDNYYLFKALWTDEPMVHILPHWNLELNPGEEVKVVTYTTGDEVELFINNESLGRRNNDKYNQLEWQVNYIPGEIKAIAYKNNKIIATEIKKTQKGPFKLDIQKDDTGNLSSDQSVAVFTVSIKDIDGNFASHLCDEMSFSLSGMVLLGTGNGDCSDHDSNTAHSRKIFNGLCQIVTQLDPEAKNYSISIKTKKYGEKSYNFEKKFKSYKELESTSREWTINQWWKSPLYFESIDLTKEINIHDVNTWEPITLNENSFKDEKGFRQYYVSTKMPNFNDNLNKASLVITGVKGHIIFKIEHNKNYWPLPEPKEFLTINREIDSDNEEIIIPLQNFKKDEAVIINFISVNTNKKSSIKSVNWLIEKK